MSRGGRRRRSKRGRIRPAAADRRQKTGGEEQDQREPGAGGRRRGPRRSSSREPSVLDQMRSLPTRLQTLPPDGTVLEELIGSMQSEYGTPTTPQEYRLIIKVPAAEEGTDPALEVVTEAVEAKTVVPHEVQDAHDRQRPSRRRRRGRRRSPGAATGDDGTSVNGPALVDEAGEADA